MKNAFNHRAGRLQSICFAIAWILAPACSAADDSATAYDPPLVYHEIAADGTVVTSRDADRPFNPASVMKIATTLWVLETLGPEHRFVTRFGYRGTFDPASGVLDGDLVVAGGSDPDFHVENAFLVARALNGQGIHTVDGAILVDGDFWIGWEGGSEKRLRDPDKRVTAMADRLRTALDPARWSPATRDGIDAFRARRSLASDDTPAVVVRGRAGRRSAQRDDGVHWIVEHRSNPVLLTLKRFNAFSNNDIERFESSVGGAAKLSAMLARRLGLASGEVRVATLSGLGRNRLDARAAVALLGALEATCERLGLTAGDVLPVLGCDPGTLSNFPRLDADRYRGALVAKTGSLNETDGGVAVLAGIVGTAQGRHLFCVAAAEVGGRLPAARAAQERWLLDRIAAAGGPGEGPCPTALPFSDTDAGARPVGLAATTAEIP